MEQKRPGDILPSSDVARFPLNRLLRRCPAGPGGHQLRALSLFTKAAIELIADHQLAVLDLLVHRLQAVKELELAADGAARHVDVGEEPARRELAELPGNLRRRPAPTARAAIEGRRCQDRRVFTDMVSGFFSQRSTRPDHRHGQYQSSVADQAFAPLK